MNDLEKIKEDVLLDNIYSKEDNFRGNAVNEIIALALKEFIEKLDLPSIMYRFDKPNVRESIFDGEDCVIPMADVSFIEKHWIKDYLKGEEKTKHNWHGLTIVMKHTVYDMTADTWANNAYLSRAEGEKFLKAWCMYRNEIENIRNDT